MCEPIDCFLAYPGVEAAAIEAKSLRGKAKSICFLTPDESIGLPEGTDKIVTDSPLSSKALEKAASKATTRYILLCLEPTQVNFSADIFDRLVAVAQCADANFVYCDFTDVMPDSMCVHPLIDYTVGSVRDDFDFGPVVLLRKCDVDAFFQYHNNSDFKYAGWYSLRLYLSRKALPFHLPENLYVAKKTDLRQSGQKQFDYVNPSNKLRQHEMEQACNIHLKAIKAYLEPETIENIDTRCGNFSVTASIIIPVRNRQRTIADAINSAFQQKTNFSFNVIVVDNHSSDDTTQIINDMQADSRLIHIIPSRHDLQIGGCWNLALDDERCGRFAVQLDSDDLYSSPNTLQQIIDCFDREKAAMVIGSYRMVNMKLETLPPGLIDHREWTDENGRNNALRINGLGAPRAFFTPIARKLRFPNTSYGEDYAMGLAISRKYKIGRIFNEIYLCRRWEGNSDAALSQEMINRNNLYKDHIRQIEICARMQLAKQRSEQQLKSQAESLFSKQLACWPEVEQRFNDLQKAQTRSFSINSTCTIEAQFNPSRIVSTGAKVDKQNIAKRPCFLCEANRPKPQLSLQTGNGFEILVNPFPILPSHFTIASRKHSPQTIKEHFHLFAQLTMSLSGSIVFYNGPSSGASAPDHMHFQAGKRGIVPIERDFGKYSLAPIFKPNNCTDSEVDGIYAINDYVCPVLAIKAVSVPTATKYFNSIYQSLPMSADEYEPRLNLIAWTENAELRILLFPRKKLRPECYFLSGDNQLLISPGAIDMGGMLITPREKDFLALNTDRAAAILREVSLSRNEFDKTISSLKETATTTLQQYA